MAYPPLSPPHPHVLGHACNKATPMLCMYVRPWPVHLRHLPIPVSSVMSACNKASPMLYVYVRPWPVHLCHLYIPMSSVMPVTRPLPCYTCTYDHGLSTSITSPSPCLRLRLLVTLPAPWTCYVRPECLRVTWPFHRYHLPIPAFGHVCS